MDEIVARTKFFIDETKASLQQKNLRNLKSDILNLLDEIECLKEYILNTGSQEQQKILKEHHELFERLAVCAQYHILPVEEEHMQQEFFDTWYNTLTPQLNALQKLLED